LVAALLARPRADGSDTDLFVQVEGDNDTRVFVGSSASRVKALLDAAAAGAEAPATWDSLPDPGATLASLAADPALPSRLVAADRRTEKGVLVFKPPEESLPPAAGPPPDAALSAYGVGNDRRVRRWSPSTNALVAEVPEIPTVIDAMATSPDGTTIAIGGGDRTIHLVKAADSTEVALGPAENGASVAAIAWHPQGTHIAAGLRDNWAVAVWDLAAKTAKRFSGHAGEVLAVAWSRDGTRLYSGGQDLQVIAWDPVAGTKLAKVADFPSEILALVPSADGALLYAGGRSNEVIAYATADGAVAARRDLGGPCLALVLSPDGTKIYAATTGVVVVLAAADLAILAKHKGPARDVTCLSLLADGKWLLAGDADGALWLWAEGSEGSSWSTPVSSHGIVVKAVALLAGVPPPSAPPSPPPGEGTPPEPPKEGGGAPPGDPSPPPGGGEAPADPPGSAPETPAPGGD
jgi:WD40 repeat protein